MSIDLGWAVGRVIEVVEYEDGSGAWWFGLRGHGGLRVDCPWQLLVAGRLHRTSGDHGQQYGLAATVDAAADATALLAGRAMVAIEVDPASADLAVQFDGDVVLRTFFVRDESTPPPLASVGPNPPPAVPPRPTSPTSQ